MLYLNRGEFVGVGRSPPPPRDGGHPRYCPAFNTVVFEIMDVDNPWQAKPASMMRMEFVR